MSLADKVAQFTADADIANQIIHGGVGVTVNTDGGPVRSLAKLVADKDAEIDSIATQSIADYTALRAYAGSAKQLNVTGYLVTAAPSGIAGLFTRDDADVASADNGGTIIVAANGKRWKRVYDGAVSLKWFAKGDGATNDSVAVQAAVTFCAGNDKQLFVPSGTYRITATISATKLIDIVGEGRNASTFLWGTNTAGDAFHFPITTGNLFWHMSGVGFATQTSGFPTNMVRVELAGAGGYCSNFEIEGCFFGPSASYSLSLDNTIGNGNGFFTGTIRRNFIHCGINGIKLGDSISIKENTITAGDVDTGIGLSTSGLLITGLGGARQLVITENNITTSGGAIALIDVEQPTVRNNQCEHPFYYGVDHEGTYDALLYFYNCLMPIVCENTVQTGASVIAGAGYAILFEGNGTIDGLIDNNDIFKGEVHHVGFGGGAYRNTLGKNRYEGGAQSVYLDAPATYPQLGVQLPLTLLNGWVKDPATSEPDPYVYYSPDGFGELHGAIKDGAGVIANLHSTISIDQARCMVPYGSSTTDFGVLQVSSGASSAVALVNAPGAYISLTGARFTWKPV